jgi:Gas vesicle synthesis protein GvpL/GvpF
VTTQCACYVYGVVPAGTRLPDELSGEVSLLAHGDVAAAVSEVRTDRPLGGREDLMAHDHVVESLAAGTTVVPLRFGAVMTGPGAVVDELLAPHHDWFVRVIGDLDERLQFTVVGTYVRDTVLREVLAEEPEVIRLRESLRELPEDSAYHERIRMGELVVRALDRKREEDGAALAEALAPYAVAVARRDPSGEDAAADVAFLVEPAKRKRFDQAVDELGERWAGRVRLRVLGPLAPYDFVPAREEV